jgi:AraC-like DNA-binding protein
MQEFYKRALLAFILLVVADALLAVVLVDRSYLSLSLLPARESSDERAIRWRHGYTLDTSAAAGGAFVRIDEKVPDLLRFDFGLPASGPDSNVSADLLARDGKGRPARLDLSKYDTVSFVAKCAPANALSFVVSAYDEHTSEPGNYLTYPPATTYFSCNEQGVPVSLDLTRLTVPEWWFGSAHRDLSLQGYSLERVERMVFGATAQSPRGVPARVEISQLTLRGRDYHSIAWLAGLVAAGWMAFGLWFFRAHARAMTANVDTQLKSDLPLVAYRQLTLEPYRDKEKASVLRFIATNYTSPELDLEAVVVATGANRTKVNSVLKSELGMTFTTYLNKLRLTEAARLLTEQTAMTVAEIAYSVGYANVSYFNRLFKEEYGCTPKAIRTLADPQERSPEPVQEAAPP